jgi:hypothetical protein
METKRFDNEMKTSKKEISDLKAYISQLEMKLEKFVDAVEDAGIPTSVTFKDPDLTQEQHLTEEGEETASPDDPLNSNNSIVVQEGEHSSIGMEQRRISTVASQNGTNPPLPSNVTSRRVSMANNDVETSTTTPTRRMSSLTQSNGDGTSSPLSSSTSATKRNTFMSVRKQSIQPLTPPFSEYQQQQNEDGGSSPHQQELHRHHRQNQSVHHQQRTFKKRNLSIDHPTSAVLFTDEDEETDSIISPRGAIADDGGGCNSSFVDALDEHGSMMVSAPPIDTKELIREIASRFSLVNEVKDTARSLSLDYYNSVMKDFSQISHEFTDPTLKTGSKTEIVIQTDPIPELPPLRTGGKGSQGGGYTPSRKGSFHFFSRERSMQLLRDEFGLTTEEQYEEREREEETGTDRGMKKAKSSKSKKFLSSSSAVSIGGNKNKGKLLQSLDEQEERAGEGDRGSDRDRNRLENDEDKDDNDEHDINNEQREMVEVENQLPFIRTTTPSLTPVHPKHQTSRSSASVLRSSVNNGSLGPLDVMPDENEHSLLDSLSILSDEGINSIQNGFIEMISLIDPIEMDDIASLDSPLTLQPQLQPHTHHQQQQQQQQQQQENQQYQQFSISRPTVSSVSATTGLGSPDKRVSFLDGSTPTTEGFYGETVTAENLELHSNEEGGSPILSDYHPNDANPSPKNSHHDCSIPNHLPLSSNEMIHPQLLEAVASAKRNQEQSQQHQFNSQYQQQQQPQKPERSSSLYSAFRPSSSSTSSAIKRPSSSSFSSQRQSQHHHQQSQQQFQQQQQQPQQQHQPVTEDTSIVTAASLTMIHEMIVKKLMRLCEQINNRFNIIDKHTIHMTNQTNYLITKVDLLFRQQQAFQNHNYRITHTVNGLFDQVGEIQPINSEYLQPIETLLTTHSEQLQGYEYQQTSMLEQVNEVHKLLQDHLISFHKKKPFGKTGVGIGGGTSADEVASGGVAGGNGVDVNSEKNFKESAFLAEVLASENVNSLLFHTSDDALISTVNVLQNEIRNIRLQSLALSQQQEVLKKEIEIIQTKSPRMGVRQPISPLKNHGEQSSSLQTQLLSKEILLKSLNELNLSDISSFKVFSNDLENMKKTLQICFHLIENQ